MNITAAKRGSLSKGERKLRLRQGRVPGVIYGKGLEPVNIDVPAKAISQILLSESGMNTVIDLTVEGDAKTLTVVVDNLVRNPISRSFEHIGLHQIKKGEKITAQVTVQLIGEPVEVLTQGALLEQMLETITVHAEPQDLPVQLDVDVSQMKLGDVLHVSDLPHNPKLEFSTSDDTAIAALHYSKTAQAAEADADAGAAAVADAASAAAAAAPASAE
ncbi:MAG: ribosomal rRNA E-loop binding protein Ctc/L25/TL5 [Capsulimonas sp.]|nr:ribosomal rRNA E-loop binding protein Ctc/L25/TL5 [Capsulimonas sp.]